MAKSGIGRLSLQKNKISLKVPIFGCVIGSARSGVLDRGVVLHPMCSIDIAVFINSPIYFLLK